MQKGELKEILNAALFAGADFAEIFIEQKESTAISCEDGKIEKINTGLDLGMGIRVIAGESTSYVHSNDLSLANGLQMAKLAGQIAHENRKRQTVQEFQMPQSVPAPVIVEQRPEQVEFDDKITLLRVADEEARALY